MSSKITSSLSTNNSTEKAAPRLGYLPALDGLRALAVLAVLFYHADVLWLPGGFLGVEVFFVVSGFLITLLLLSEYRANRSVNLLQFWKRRARRLLPALFTLLLAVMVYAVLFLPDEVASLRADVLASFTYITNWYLIAAQQSYFEVMGRPSLLRHLWSLAVEEQFYLLWPLLFAFLLTRLKTRTAMLVLMGGATASALWMGALFQPDADPSRIYYGTDTRAAGLLIGAALAFVSQGRAQIQISTARRWLLDAVGIAALGALAAGALLMSEFDPFLYQGGMLLVSAFTALVIAAAVAPQSPLLGQVLGMGILRWIGLRSYSLYLWHWPVFMVTRPQLDTTLEGTPLLVLRFAITFALAELSYRLIETPIRGGAFGKAWHSWNNVKGARRWVLGTAATGSFAAMTIGAIILAGAIIRAQPTQAPNYVLMTAEDESISVAQEFGGLPLPLPDKPVVTPAVAAAPDTSETLGDDPVMTEHLMDRPFAIKTPEDVTVASEAFLDDPVMTENLLDKSFAIKTIEDKPLAPATQSDATIVSAVIPDTTVASAQTSDASVALKPTPDASIASVTIPETPVTNVMTPEAPVGSVATSETPVASLAISETPVISLVTPEAPVTSVVTPEAPVASVATPETPVASFATPETAFVNAITPEVDSASQDLSSVSYVILDEVDTIAPSQPSASAWQDNSARPYSSISVPQIGANPGEMTQLPVTSVRNAAGEGRVSSCNEQCEFRLEMQRTKNGGIRAVTPPARKPVGKAPITTTKTTPPQVASAVPIAPPQEPQVFAIGDSVMLGAFNYLRRDVAAIDVDAKVGRQVSAALKILQERADAHRLTPVVIVHLGNNGTFSVKQFDEMMTVLQDVPRVIFLTTRVPRKWQEPNNTALEEGVKRYPNAVLVDWNGASTAHPEWFWNDGIHLRPEGAEIYTALIAEAVSRTAQ